MPINLPGSQVLPGADSYVNVINPISGNITRLNVATWSTEEEFRTGPNKADSGSNGFPIRRITGVDSRILLKVWWDASNSPRSLLLQGWGCGLQLGISSLARYQSYGYSAQQFFILLSGMLKSFRTLANSEGNDGEEGIIIAEAVVQPNATRLFLLPDEQSDYTLEVARLTLAGQINAPAQFTVMQ